MKSLGNLQEVQHLDLRSLRMDDRLAASMEWDKAILPKHLRYLCIRSICFRRLPSFIDPTLLPSLSYLELGVDHIDEAGLRVLGGLPDLRCLSILPPDLIRGPADYGTVVNVAAHDVFFPKLRILKLFGWMVQLATNDDSTSASFSICRGG